MVPTDPRIPVLPPGRPRAARRCLQALAAVSLLLIASCGGSDDAATVVDDKPPLQWGSGSWDQVRWQ